MAGGSLADPNYSRFTGSSVSAHICRSARRSPETFGATQGSNGLRSSPAPVWILKRRAIGHQASGFRKSTQSEDRGETMLRCSIRDLGRAYVDYRILKHHKAVATSADCQQSIVDFGGSLYLHMLNTDPECLGRFFDCFDHRSVNCIAWIQDDSDAAKGRNHFLQKLKPLGSHLWKRE